MEEYCSIVPKVKNDKGELVNSILFTEIQNYLKQKSKIPNIQFANVAVENGKLSLTEGVDSKKLRIRNIKLYNFTKTNIFRKKFNRYKRKHKDAVDKNGEPTLKSFLYVSGVLDYEKEEERVISLNYALGAYDLDDKSDTVKYKTYTKKMAMSIAQEFNYADSARKEYIAIIRPVEKGTELTTDKWNVEVVRRTTENIQNLKKLVSKLNLFDRLQYFCMQRGLDITVVKEGKTEYDLKLLDDNSHHFIIAGLLGCIKIAQNDAENMSFRSAQAIAHCMLKLFSSDPNSNSIIKRLLNLSTPDVISNIAMPEDIREEALDKSGEEQQMYIASCIVANNIVLQSLNKNKNFIEKLISRLLNNVKRIFVKVNPNSITELQKMANITAEKIVNEFTSFENNTNLATYKRSNTTDELWKQFRASIDNLRKELSTVSKESETILEPLLKVIDTGNTAINPLMQMSNYLYQKAFTESVVELTNIIKELENTISKFYIEREASFEELIKEKGTTIRQMLIIRNRLKDINTDIFVKLPWIQNPDSRSERIYLENEKGESQVGTFKYFYNSFINLFETQTAAMIHLNEINKELFKKYLQQFTGKEYIDNLEGIGYFNQTVSGDDIKKISNKLLRCISSLTKRKLSSPMKNEITISELMEQVFGDIPSQYMSLLMPMSDNPDILSQLIQKAVRYSIEEETDSITEVQNRLRSLRDRFKKIKIYDENGTLRHLTTRDLYEKTTIFIDGKAVETDEGLSGHFNSEYYMELYYSEYEKLQNEALEDLKKELKFTGHDWKDDYTDTERIILFNKYWKKHKFQTRWKNDNVKIEGKGLLKKKLPNDKYKNTRFIKLLEDNPEFKEWYDDLMALKNELDMLLPNGATVTTKAPQYRGTVINSILNKAQHEDILSSSYQVLKDKFLGNLTRHSADEDYGGDDYESIAPNNIIVDEMNVYQNKFKRIPLYGIHSLKRGSKNKEVSVEDELSTDIFYSMFAYANMCYNYKSLYRSLDMMFIAKDVMEKRTALNPTTGLNENVNEIDSKRTLSEFLKNWMGKTFFGFNKLLMGNVSISKAADWVYSKGPKLFLSFNLTGGIVNKNTGRIELWKEAASDNYFNTSDFLKAELEYMKYGPASLMHEVLDSTGSGNKLDLMIRHFNMFQDNSKRQHEWKPERSKFFNVLDNVPMIFYSTGEHYMQSMTYIMRANNITLYDYNGNKTNLWDSYKTYVDENGNTVLVQTSDLEQYLAHKKKYEELVSAKKEYIRLTDKKAENYESTINSFDTDIQNELSKIDKLTFFYKNVDNSSQKDDFTMAQSIIDKIDDRLREKIANNDSPNNLTLTDEELAVLKKMFSKYEKVPLTLNYIEDHLKSVRNIVATESKKLVWTNTDRLDYMDLCRALNNRMHGVYNNMDKTQFQLTLVGKLIFGMKGYLLGIIPRRYGKTKFNSSMNTITEGTTMTAKTLVFKSIQEQTLSLIPLLVTARFLPRKCAKWQESKQTLQALGFNDFQIANIRRFSHDLWTQIGLSLLRNILYVLSVPITGNDDDDDELEEYSYFKQHLMGYIYLVMFRLLREQSTISPLGIASTMLSTQSPTNKIDSTLNTPIKKLGEKIRGRELDKDDLNIPVGIKGDSNSFNTMPAGVSAVVDIASWIWLGLNTFVNMDEYDDSRYYYQKDSQFYIDEPQTLFQKTNNTLYNYKKLDDEAAEDMSKFQIFMNTKFAKKALKWSPIRSGFQFNDPWGTARNLDYTSQVKR